MALTWFWLPFRDLRSSSGGFFLDHLSIITTWRLTAAWCKPKRAQYGTHSSFYGLGLGNHTQLFGGGKVGFFSPSIRVDLTRGGMNTRRQRSLGVFLGACGCTRNSEHAVPFASAALASLLPHPCPSILLEPSLMPLWHLWRVL